MFWWAGTVATWCVLAAIVDPERLLPYGVGLLVAIIVIIAVWRDMRMQVTKIQEAIEKAVDKYMQGVLRSIKTNFEMYSVGQMTEALELRAHIESHEEKPQAPVPLKVDDQAGF